MGQFGLQQVGRAARQLDSAESQNNRYRKLCADKNEACRGPRRASLMGSPPDDIPRSASACFQCGDETG